MTQSSVLQHFAADHDRLDALFTNFQKSKKENFPQAKEYFVAFKFGLQRHIVWEEEVLFPLFEKKTGMSDFGPTAVMRKEHRMIGEALEAIHRKVKEGNLESDADEAQLLTVLASHNMKEEKILYPAIDQSLNLQETTEIFQRMKDIPPERYQTCCGGH